MLARAVVSPLASSLGLVMALERLVELSDSERAIASVPTVMFGTMVKLASAMLLSLPLAFDPCQTEERASEKIAAPRERLDLLLLLLPSPRLKGRNAPGTCAAFELPSEAKEGSLVKGGPDIGATCPEIEGVAIPSGPARPEGSDLESDGRGGRGPESGSRRKVLFDSPADM